MSSGMNDAFAIRISLSCLELTELELGFRQSHLRRTSRLPPGHFPLLRLELRLARRADLDIAAFQFQIGTSRSQQHMLLGAGVDVAVGACHGDGLFSGEVSFVLLGLDADAATGGVQGDAGLLDRTAAGLAALGVQGDAFGGHDGKLALGDEVEVLPSAERGVGAADPDVLFGGDGDEAVLAVDDQVRFAPGRGTALAAIDAGTG